VRRGLTESYGRQRDGHRGRDGALELALDGAVGRPACLRVNTSRLAVS